MKNYIEDLLKNVLLKGLKFIFAYKLDMYIKTILVWIKILKVSSRFQVLGVIFKLLKFIIYKYT